MSDEKKETSQNETFFLPPLKMILSASDKETCQNESKDKDAEKQEVSDEKIVARLIEKLSEKEE
jgi:hypothetical protein